VRFNGNAYTSGERASDFTLLRSAELAREHDYAYFLIVQSKGGNSYSTHTTPTQSHKTETATTYGNTSDVSAHTTTSGGNTYVYAKPSTLKTIVCFRERPENIQGMAYNSEFVSRSQSQKYGIAAK